jgi:CelD/BcsL family acetyltransferase involved in cellulose biosynthesis
MIDVLERFEHASDRWDELAAQAGSIFSTVEWARAWWNHFGAGKSLVLAHVRDGAGQPVAILPLHSERHGGVRILRFLGHGVADQLGPVCHPSQIGVATTALSELSGRSGLLLAERFRADTDWSALGGRVLYEESSPSIGIAREGGWDAYLSARSANFRGQVRRRSRRLARDLGLRYRLVDDPAQLAPALDALFALHGARWRQLSTALTGAREAFHREFAAVALERGWLRLWVADSGGRPVAVWYGFRFAGDEYYYQSGWDPAYAQFGIGIAILEHSIREAFADGVAEYRLLRGDEAYKRRYASTDAKVQTIAVPHDLISHGVVGVASALSHARLGRRLLNRLAGATGG